MDKEKLKSIGNLIFKIAGALSIAFVVIFFVTVVDQYSYSSQRSAVEEDGFESSFSPSSDEESLKGDDLSNYDSDGSEIVKTGEISMTVDNIDKAFAEFNNIKDQYEGDITYSYEGGEGVDRYVYVTLKIKSSEFEEVVGKISQIEGELNYSYSNTTDITEQYVDLESRLRNLEAVETQLLEIMDSAETVEETLAVYTELASTRSQIEVLKGEIRYLDSQTDYSYITVTFSLSSTGAEISEEEWKPLGVLKDAFRAFVSVLKGIGNTLIWVLVFSPIALVGFGVYLLVRKKGKQSKK